MSQTETTPEAAALTDEELRLLDAYWRAANYLSVGQIYLLDNPLLREPLKAEHVKPRLLGHFGTVPGLNLIYAHPNRAIRMRDFSAIYIYRSGPRRPALVANAYLEGTYGELYPDVAANEAGLKRLFRQFSFPGGILSHVAPEVPGSIHEGGELGYALVHAFGAAFDNPDLLVACVVGDGEAETGPLAASWHLEQVPRPEDRRRRAAGAAPERLQDRQSDRPGEDSRAGARRAVRGLRLAAAARVRRLDGEDPRTSTSGSPQRSTRHSTGSTIQRAARENDDPRGLRGRC